MVKTKYEIDPYNRLIIKGSGRKTHLPRYRRVVDGRFRITNGNSLEYLVRSPQGAVENIPNEIRLDGRWSFSKDHDLKLTLGRSSRSIEDDELIIKGSIIDAGKNSLRFAATTRSSDGVMTTYVMEFAGVWQSDSRNRLTFRIRKDRGPVDILTFEGGWEVNKDNELVYRYEHRDGMRKKKVVHTIIFRGRWDISNGKAFTYTLDAGTNSAFTFRAGLARFKEDRIEYQIGVGYSKKNRPNIKTLIIYGSWSIAKDSGLSFEIEGSDGRIYAISFSAEASLTAKDALLFKLKTGPRMRDLGLTLELSRSMLGSEGAAFIRYLKTHEESAILIGATKNW